MSKERQFDGIRKLGAEKEELPSAVSTPLFQPFWFEKIASSTDFIRLLNQKERRLIRIWDHYVTISLKFRSIRIEMEKRRILPRSNDFVRVLWISCKTVGERSSRSTRLIYKSNCEVNGESFDRILPRPPFQPMIEIWLLVRKKRIEIARKFKVHYIIGNLFYQCNYFSMFLELVRSHFIFYRVSKIRSFNHSRVNYRLTRSRIKRLDAIECFLAKLLARVTLQKSNFLMSRIRTTTRMQSSG